jgi:hypothetical protein
LCIVCAIPALSNFCPSLNWLLDLEILKAYFANIVLRLKTGVWLRPYLPMQTQQYKTLLVQPPLIYTPLEVNRAEYCGDQIQRWTETKHRSDRMASILETSESFREVARRMRLCSSILVPVRSPRQAFSLRPYSSCDFALCPACLGRPWRVRNKFPDAVRPMLQAFQGANVLALTLTVPNVHVKELRAGLKASHQALTRLVRREPFKHALGCARTTEITRSYDDKVHPHLHCFVLMPPGNKHRIDSCQLSELWRSSTRLDHTPSVKVSNCYDAKGWMHYISKPPIDIVGIMDNGDVRQTAGFVLELARQVRGVHLFASSGVVQDAARTTKGCKTSVSRHSLPSEKIITGLQWDPSGSEFREWVN